MYFRDYLIMMSIGTAAAFIAWGAVLFTVDPLKTGAIGIALFYGTLSCALIGALSIIGASIRTRFKKDDIVSRHVSRAFRQAVLLTGMIIGSLALLSSDLFRWWTVGLLLLAGTSVELAFLTMRRRM